MRSLRPPLWLGVGGYALLIACALFASCATPMVGWQFALAAPLAVLVVVAFIDARGTWNALALHRSVPRRLVLGRASALRVDVVNRSARHLHVGLVEAPAVGVDVALAPVCGAVAAMSAASFDIDVLPRERGAARFTATYAWFESDWRVVRRRVRIDDDVVVRVLPDVPAFTDTDDLAVRSRMRDAGLRRLRRPGAGTEFAALRDYASGDAYRDIDWRATARRMHVVVAERETERSQQIGLVVDAGRLMAARIDGRRKLDIAISAALGVATYAQAAGDRVGVHAFAAATLARTAPAPGVRGFAAAFAALAAVEPRAEEADYERAALELLSTYRKRALLVVFTDVFDPAASTRLVGALATLARRHVVVLALMSDGVVAAALADEAVSSTRRAVARMLARERASLVAAARARGLVAVDVPAAQLRPAVLDAYVAAVRRGRL